MGAGKVVVDVLLSIGKWVVKNPSIIKDTADAVVRLKPSKDSKDVAEPTVEDKLNQLGEAVIEINQKVDTEINKLSKELKTIKTALFLMAGLLGISIVAIVLLAVL